MGKKKESKEGPHVCTICDRSFAKAGGLALHITKMHTDKTGYSFRCTMKGCSAAPHPSQKALDRHIRRNHVEKQKEFKNICDKCNLERDSRADLIKHRYRHRIFDCSTPNCWKKNFASREAILKHRRVVHGLFGQSKRPRRSKSAGKEKPAAPHKLGPGPIDNPASPPLGDYVPKVKPVSIPDSGDDDSDSDEDDDFTCLVPRCGKKFMSAASLEKHLKTSHTDGMSQGGPDALLPPNGSERVNYANGYRPVYQPLVDTTNYDGAAREIVKREASDSADSPPPTKINIKSNAEKRRVTTERPIAAKRKYVWKSERKNKGKFYDSRKDDGKNGDMDGDNDDAEDPEGADGGNQGDEMT